MGTVVLVRTGSAGLLQKRGPQGEGSWREDEKGCGGRMSQENVDREERVAATLPSASCRGSSPAPNTLVTSHKDAEPLLGFLPWAPQKPGAMLRPPGRVCFMNN